MLLKRSGRSREGFWSKIKKAPISFPARVGLLLLLVAVFFVFFAPIKNVASPIPEKKVASQSVLGVVLKSGPTVTPGEVTAKEAHPEVAGVHVPIVFYHYIEVNPRPKDDPGRDKLLVWPSNFDSQMKYLKDNGWTTITLDDLVAAFKNPAGLPAKPIILTFDDGYTDFYTNAWPILQKYNLKATLYVLGRGPEKDANAYMSAAEIRELAQSPLITVASHTQDHAYLKGRSELFQRYEIVRSKERLEEVTGKPVRHFAYPYGAFDDVSLKLVKEAGYETAASTIISTRNNESTRYTLRRVRIGNYPAGKYFIDQITK